MNEAYARLIADFKEVQGLGAIAGLLNWDQETYMPPKGAAARAEMIALTAGLAHEKLVRDEVGDLLSKLDGDGDGAGLGEAEKANVREIRRAYTREKKLPAELVRELARTTSLAQEHWVKARKEARFEEFAPWLEKIVALKRKVCEAIGYVKHPYDALLDEYEPGARAADLAPLFAELKGTLVPLVAAMGVSDRKPDPTILKRTYPTDRQREFGLSVIRDMGFDLEAGRLDVSAHPFCSSCSPGDVRLTTRYQERDLRSALFGSMHEAGHGLYEQGVDRAHEWTPMGTAASTGIHESQSRLWENFVGRSRPFWSHYFPKLKATFSEALGDVTLEQFYFAINEVRPSLIRVEADEVTYNLHILLRFELEQELLSGKLSVSELPGVWNQRMTEYLGVTPEDDAEGVLQDIHWSAGLMGYFPTYTLGNLYAAQLFAKARKDMPDLEARVAKGELLPLKKWLNEKVHRKGMLLRPADLIRDVTGEAPRADFFAGYLRAKFGELYGL